jgi:hypothetical protein
VGLVVDPHVEVVYVWLGPPRGTHVSDGEELRKLLTKVEDLLEPHPHVLGSQGEVAGPF